MDTSAATYHTSRSGGLRIDLTHPQARRTDTIRSSRRPTHNRAVERLPPDPARYDISKEFTGLRRNAPHLYGVGRACQNTAIHQAPPRTYPVRERRVGVPLRKA